MALKISLTVLEARSPKSTFLGRNQGVSRAMPSLGALGRVVPPQAAAGTSQLVDACLPALLPPCGIPAGQNRTPGHLMPGRCFPTSGVSTSLGRRLWLTVQKPRDSNPGWNSPGGLCWIRDPFFWLGLLVTVRPRRFRAQFYQVVPTSDASQSPIHVLLTDWL